MHISEFDYELPAELIAQQPLERRDASRMMVVNRDSQTWAESNFALFPELVRAGDVVVINNTRVFPARLVGQRDPSGGRVEVLIDEVGETPLPPYIKRDGGSTETDRERYQTMFAREKGAIAAPTAGLHFTPAIMQTLSDRGARVSEITLHVGYGTFEPVRVDEIEAHKVTAEYFKISAAAANTINEARAEGGRVIAVGTTTTRALETAAGADGIIKPGNGATELTIKPGYNFHAVDA